MRKDYLAPEPMKAHFVQSLLEAAGIEAEVHDRE